MAKKIAKSQEAKLDRLQKALESSWDELDKKSRPLVAINDDPESEDSGIEAIESLAYAGVDYHTNHDAVYAYRDGLEAKRVDPKYL
jgi:ABC-type molybdate transport system substrate-binding protein